MPTAAQLRLLLAPYSVYDGAKVQDETFLLGSTLYDLASHLPTLNLSLLFCKMGTIVATTSHALVRMT